MDQADYWAIADADIEIQNPVTDRKHRLLDDYCDIRDGLKILDVGCGKAWMLRQWAERFRIEGTGIDTNPVFLSTARRKSPARGSLRFFQGRALKFEAPDESFDVVMCLGATDALGGFLRQHLRRVHRHARADRSNQVGNVVWLVHRMLPRAFSLIRLNLVNSAHLPGCVLELCVQYGTPRLRTL